jgi:fatty-acyl-CoA synthase
VVADAGVTLLVHSAEFETEAAALRDEFGLLTVCLDKPATGSPSLHYEDLIERSSGTSILRAGPNDDEDPAWITYTSGTTGRPKGIVLSHRSIREVALNLLLELRPVRQGELLVLPQPLSHGAGYWVLPALASGAGVYVTKQFDAGEVCAVSKRANVRTLKCVPAMLPPLLESAADFEYETVIYGASPMPQPVLAAALERFGPVLMQIYGQSEAPVTLTCLKKEDHLDNDRRFSAGRAFQAVGVEVWNEEGRLVRPGVEGEVAVTGAHLMSGYLGMEEETNDVSHDGWILTRDMGVMDEHGFLRLLGRRDEIIISGGYNISPREVENILAQYPGVEEVAVAGVPDERWGSVVAAAVKMESGIVATAQEMIDFARPRLTFRAPKHVAFVEAIPKTAYGKVDRAKLAEAIQSPIKDVG